MLIKQSFLLLAYKSSELRMFFSYPYLISSFNSEFRSTFYDKLNSREHISQICQTCHYHICDLRRICWYLPLSIATILAPALVTSRLDYCNSGFNNIAINDITKLRVQNCLAMVVTRSPRFTHSKPLLKSALASCPMS